MQSQKARFIKVHASKDDVRRLYARLSYLYDSWGFLTESKAVDRAVELANIQDGENILEVAVGTGTLFKRIVALNHNGKNEGIDLSPDMLSRAKKRLGKRFTNYSLQVGDAYSLEHSDDTFDVLFNNYMFDLLPEEDFGQVLLEFKRVLKHGGRMVITSMTFGRRWYSRIWDWMVHKNPSLLAGCRPVSLEEDIMHADFENIHAEYVSQLTFPSMVIYAEKP
ncbi:class I SAM-dependent methyltransferase [Chloroflexota bacterium]